MAAARTPAPSRVVGLDLGKSVDFTALTVVEWVPQKGAKRPTYNVPALKRWPLGTNYTAIAEWLVSLFRSPDFSSGPPALLVVDETGVGVACVEIIWRELLRARCRVSMRAVTITAGSGYSLVGNGKWRCSKKELASVLVALFQGRRLQVAELPETGALIREAQAFSVKVTPAGNETFESWRENEHDDLVLSLGLAAWAAETLRPPSPPPGPSRYTT